jgi:hypothetical protein
MPPGRFWKPLGKVITEEREEQGREKGASLGEEGQLLEVGEALVVVFERGEVDGGGTAVVRRVIEVELVVCGVISVFAADEVVLGVF